MVSYKLARYRVGELMKMKLLMAFCMVCWVDSYTVLAYNCLFYVYYIFFIILKKKKLFHEGATASFISFYI